MPPKTRTAREDILRAALTLIRERGESALNARALAVQLGCSTQPIFSCFSSMEALRRALIDRAGEICDARIQEEVARGVYPPYKASGMAYIRFASEERTLFRLLFMRDRRAEAEEDSSGLFGRMVALVRGSTGLAEERANLFHLEMWAFVHGIATMILTDYVMLDEELISRMMTDAYHGLQSRFREECV